MHPVADKLAQHLETHDSLFFARDDYKLETWVAVEAYCCFAADKESEWCVNPGDLPYMTRAYAEKKKQEKWCDVYARKVVAGRAEEHLWIEFKGLPRGASKKSRAEVLKKFVEDINFLLQLDRPRTEMFWGDRRNPNTNTSQAGWFSKFAMACKDKFKDASPGAIEQGTFTGLAILLAACEDQRELDALAKDVRTRTDNAEIEVPQPEKVLLPRKDTGPGLGLIVYDLGKIPREVG